MEDFLLGPHDVVIFAERKLAFITLVPKQSHIILKMTRFLRFKIAETFSAHLSTISSALPDKASVVLIQEHLTLVALQIIIQMIITISSVPTHLEAGRVPGEIWRHPKDELVMDGAVAAHTQRGR